MDFRTTNLYVQYTQFGALNGTGTQIIFNKPTKTQLACGYASQVNPTTTSGSATAAGTQLTYDMISLIRLNYINGAVDPTFNPQGRGINYVDNGQGFPGGLLTDLGSTTRAIQAAIKTDVLGNPQ